MAHNIAAFIPKVDLAHEGVAAVNAVHVRVDFVERFVQLLVLVPVLVSGIVDVVAVRVSYEPFVVRSKADKLQRSVVFLR
jgi:hypothetical protein